MQIKKKKTKQKYVNLKKGVMMKKYLFVVLLIALVGTLSAQVMLKYDYKSAVGYIEPGTVVRLNVAGQLMLMSGNPAPSPVNDIIGIVLDFQIVGVDTFYQVVNSDNAYAKLNAGVAPGTYLTYDGTAGNVGKLIAWVFGGPPIVAVAGETGLGTLPANPYVKIFVLIRWPEAEPTEVGTCCVAKLFGLVIGDDGLVEAPVVDVTWLDIFAYTVPVPCCCGEDGDSIAVDFIVNIRAEDTNVLEGRLWGAYLEIQLLSSIAGVVDNHIVRLLDRDYYEDENFTLRSSEWVYCLPANWPVTYTVQARVVNMPFKSGIVQAWNAEALLVKDPCPPGFW